MIGIPLPSLVATPYLEDLPPVAFLVLLQQPLPVHLSAPIFLFKKKIVERSRDNISTSWLGYLFFLSRCWKAQAINSSWPAWGEKKEKKMKNKKIKKRLRFTSQIFRAPRLSRIPIHVAYKEILQLLKHSLSCLDFYVRHYCRYQVNSCNIERQKLHVLKDKLIIKQYSLSSIAR